MARAPADIPRGKVVEATVRKTRLPILKVGRV